MASDVGTCQYRTCFLITRNFSQAANQISNVRVDRTEGNETNYSLNETAQHYTGKEFI